MENEYMNLYENEDGSFSYSETNGGVRGYTRCPPSKPQISSTILIDKTYLKQPQENNSGGSGFPFTGKDILNMSASELSDLLSNAVSQGNISLADAKQIYLYYRSIKEKEEIINKFRELKRTNEEEISELEEKRDELMNGEDKKIVVKKKNRW